MERAAVLRTARRSAGVTQQQLALLANVAQPEISDIENGRRQPSAVLLSALLKPLGYGLLVAPAVGTTTLSASTQIMDSLVDDRPDNAIRGFLNLSDNLRRNHGIDRVVIGLSEPALTGSKEWDAALAAVVEYWFNDESLPLPHWVNSPLRTLADASAPQLGAFDSDPDISQVPREFRDRNVLLETRTLASV